MKVKHSHNTPMKGQGGEYVGHSSYLFSTWALDGGGQRHALAALYPWGKDPGTHCAEAGWAPEPVWTQRLEEKSLASAGDRTPIARLSSPYSAPFNGFLRMTNSVRRFVETNGVMAVRTTIWDRGRNRGKYIMRSF
jgi:hypothetical protein